MEKMVEVEPATQDELRQDLKSLSSGRRSAANARDTMVGARRFERVGSRKGRGTYLRRLLRAWVRST